MRRDKDKSASRAKKWLKVAAWIMGISLFFFVGLIFFTTWLQHKLEDLVAEQSKGVYRLQLHGLEASPFVGSVSVDSLSLNPDYERWQELNKQKNEVPRTLLALRSGPVRLQHLNFFKALFKQKVQLEELEIIKPKLLMSEMKRDTTKTHKPLHASTKGFLYGLFIGKIDIRNASLHYRDGTRKDTLLSVRQFKLAVDDFRLDSASFAAKDRVYYAQKFDLDVQDASYRFPDGLYSLRSDSIKVNTSSGELLARHLQLEPLLGPAEMARAEGKAVTHQKLEMKELRMLGIDFGEHSRTNEIRIRQILLQSPMLEAFKDKQHFRNKGEKELPHDLVQSIKTPFLVDTLEVKSGYVRYEELVPEASERGHITFHQVNVLASNISNIPSQITLEKPAVINASSMVMDRAKLELTVRLPLLNQNGYHTLEGSVGEGNLQMLNPILVPTGFVRIESGYVRRGRFKAELNKTNANGSLYLLYDDLKVELLSKGTGGDQSLGKEVLSFLANKVAIKGSNPSKGEEPRTGSITVTRDPKRSVFSYWKECFNSGFLSSMGLDGMAKK